MKKTKQFILAKSIGVYLNFLSFFNLEKATYNAYQLFSQPRKGKLKKEQLPKTLQTATLETLSYQDEHFQLYSWKGNQESILLIHGWESNASRWKKLLPYLQKTGKTILAIDAPAHGLSSGKEFNAPKYAEFIQALTQKYNPQILIGHSIGGAAICYYLHQYNNPNIQKIIMLGSPSEFKIMSNNFIKLLGLNGKIQTALENHYHQKFKIHINDFSGHLFAKNFKQKALIAHDIQDEIVKIEEGRKYASCWKNATYIETSGLGHSMHDAKLYNQIIEFINEK